MVAEGAAGAEPAHKRAKQAEVAALDGDGAHTGTVKTDLAPCCHVFESIYTTEGLSVRVCVCMCGEDAVFLVSFAK